MLLLPVIFLSPPIDEEKELGGLLVVERPFALLLPARRLSEADETRETDVASGITLDRVRPDVAKVGEDRADADAVGFDSEAATAVLSPEIDRCCCPTDPEELLKKNRNRYAPKLPLFR